MDLKAFFHSFHPGLTSGVNNRKNIIESRQGRHT
jgi:hypothetical protein